MSRPRSGDRVQVRVEGLDADGLGTARLDGLRLTVEDGLPGEEGEVVLLHVGRERAHGRMVQRAHPAAGRRARLPCPRWTAASPCRVMHLEPAAQAAFKRERVRQALAAHGLAQVPVAETVRSPRALGWRARVTYVAARRRGRLVLGAYRRGTHVVQDMAGCPLEERPVAEAAAALRAALEALEVPVARPDLETARDDGCGAPRHVEAALSGPGRLPADERLRPDGLRYAVLRADASGAVIVALLTPSGRLDAAEAVAARLRADCPRVSGVWVGRSGPGDVIFGPGDPTSVGEARPLEERLGGLVFGISPRAFFQVNRGAAEVLHGLAAEAAGGGRVVDVYTGVGALALRMARQAERVVGIESVAPAIEDARRNAARNGLSDRTDFRCADAAAGLRQLAREGFRPDAIALNPPRKGCAPEVLDATVTLAPARVVYVSCNPDTLARDLARLAAAGLAVLDVTPVDLFPQSEHVESVARVAATPA